MRRKFVARGAEWDRLLAKIQLYIVLNNYTRPSFNS